MESDSRWTCALELDQQERVTAGSGLQLCHAVRNGADLRTYTKFYFEEHISPDRSEV